MDGICVVFIFQLPQCTVLQELRGGGSTKVGSHRKFNSIYVQLIPTMWPSKHMYRTSLLYAWIWTFSNCGDVMSDKITNTKNSISCVCRVKVGLTKPKLLICWPLIFNCNLDPFKNICLSTMSNMYRYQNINLHHYPHSFPLKTWFGVILIVALERNEKVIGNRKLYMCKLILAMWPSKHMDHTSLVCAWIWTLSSCVDAVLGKIDA
jgi:hypothetical protein